MQFKWVTYKIDDAGLEVVVDQLGAPSSSYDQFLAVLPEGRCRYAGVMIVTASYFDVCMHMLVASRLELPFTLSLHTEESVLVCPSCALQCLTTRTRTQTQGKSSTS
jgi:hypothetical protein